MNRLFVITQFITLSVGYNCFSQNFQNIFSYSRCGLNYTQASVLLGKKMAPYGYPYYGVDQPAPLTISGIPAGAKIEKAFIWWDIAGSDTAENVILQNPNSITDTFPGVLIGGNANMCWGPGHAFRADVTTVISGNGTYMINGLPTDTTFNFINKSDVDGATLFIIYSNPSATFIGNIMINDGYAKVYNSTITESMNLLPPADTSYGNAFMITSDMQGEPGTKIKLNNGPYLSITQDFWDFEEKTAVFTPNETTSVFGIQSPNDCCNLITIGVYFQTPSIPLSPAVSRTGDNLTSSSGSGYQWYLNGSAISNATSQTYLASASGTYYAEVSDSFGCVYSSPQLNVIICAEKIKPNINFSSPDSLWTDSVNYSLQWYLNGNAIANATLPYYIATVTGSYWVQTQDTTGCSVNSNIIPVTITGVDEIQDTRYRIQVYPNPNDGKFVIEVRSRKPEVGRITIYSILGEIVYKSEIRNQDISNLDGTPSVSYMKSEINLSSYPKGIYFLKITGDKNVGVKKIIIE